ncbi:MAG: hypothetical protein QNJ73_07175 [Gammaproteobacteria bacterium]|nr:hypothetical protein [Gammaproteobacteria bacterium]
MRLKDTVRVLQGKHPKKSRRPAGSPDPQLLLLGRLLALNVRALGQIGSLHEAEFKVFSQFGDDGIIQWLVHHVQIPHDTFIEFGVEDYSESNTRFLMMNNNWSGFVMDGSEENIERLKTSESFWKYELFAEAAFVDTENINDLIAKAPFDREIGLLHIDIDGNDYWVWQAIDTISPIVVVLEYNSVFGAERAITIPYDNAFYRTTAHYSNLYFGASLRALYNLSDSKGYGFVGCNSAGNNAYFVRRDKLNNVVREISLEAGFVASKYRESRDADGNLTLLAGDERLAVIRGMPVVNTDTGEIEKL